jgi:hypothetical protein
MRTPPSPWSIIWTDNVCCALTTTAPLIFGVGLAIKLTGAIPGSRGRPDTPLDPVVASLVLAGAVAVVLCMSAIVVVRVRRVRSLFEEGREVEARVRKITYFQGGARQKLKFAFELDGTPYEVTSVFLRSSRTPRFSEGDRIPVLVDPEDPTRAIPLAVYADPGAGHGQLPPAPQSIRQYR